MASLLKSTNNTRPLLSDSLRYIRSDVPHRITEEEIKWLLENNITTVVDLREESEREGKVCPLINRNEFEYICMPVTGGNVVPPSPEDVARSYIKMADENMEKIIKTVTECKTNVMYFCNAGKDRTGVVSAILLHKMGMDREYIINDYMQSADNLRDMLSDFAANNPEIDVRVITPHREYIESFLDFIEERNK
ncbi:MAG: tyrosine-protein phosphatase [Ruminococcaceae bacterium]|nr:tyrosine-protein phosphatase [Oscillospiraceae bacterium]